MVVSIRLYSLSRKEVMGVLRELMKLTSLPISEGLKMTSKCVCVVLPDGVVVHGSTHN